MVYSALRRTYAVWLAHVTFSLFAVSGKSVCRMSIQSLVSSCDLHPTTSCFPLKEISIINIQECSHHGSRYGPMLPFNNIRPFINFSFHFFLLGRFNSFPIKKGTRPNMEARRGPALRFPPEALSLLLPWPWLCLLPCN